MTTHQDRLTVIAMRDAWDMALEEAAAICDREAANPSSLWEEKLCWMHAAENCAAAIRAMRNTDDG